MLAYKATDPDLADCGPTVAFLSRFHRLIKAMTSRSSLRSLSPDNESFKVVYIYLFISASFSCFNLPLISKFKDINNFREYLNQWEMEAKKNDYIFMSQSGCLGFNVTLRSAIEVMTFLCSKCNFKFLMTSRLNQDALEVFCKKFTYIGVVDTLRKTYFDIFQLCFYLTISNDLIAVNFKI